MALIQCIIYIIYNIYISTSSTLSTINIKYKVSVSIPSISIKTYHSIKTYSIKTYRKHIKDLSSRNTFQLQEERYLLFILFHGSMLRWSIHRQKSPQISSTKFWLWAYWLFLAVLIRQKDLYVIIKFMHSISLRIYIYNIEFWCNALINCCYLK